MDHVRGMRATIYFVYQQGNDVLAGELKYSCSAATHQLPDGGAELGALEPPRLVRVQHLQQLDHESKTRPVRTKNSSTPQSTEVALQAEHVIANWLCESPASLNHINCAW